MWFKKNETAEATREVLTHSELNEIQLKLVTEIDELSEEELKQLICEGMIVPNEVKIKLYDFLVEFNLLDAVIDQLYRNYAEMKRPVSSNVKAKKADLNTLFMDKVKFQNFLINLNIFDIEEIRRKLIIIEDSIKLRNRIAHAIPIWHASGKSILFHSYDGMFWNKLYNILRASEDKIHKNQHFKKLLAKKELNSSDFSYVLYHIYQLNFLKEKMEELRLRLMQAL